MWLENGVWILVISGWVAGEFADLRIQQFIVYVWGWRGPNLPAGNPNHESGATIPIFEF